MPLQFKAGVVTLIALWMAVCMGLYGGAAVGFNVDDRANATMTFNVDTGEVQLGENTSNIYESPTEEELEGRENDEPEWQQETEANIQSALPELNEPPKLIPDSVTDRVEQVREEMAYQFAEQMWLVIAGVGDPVAGWVFDNRDWLHEGSVYGVVSLVSISPFVTVGYALFKRFKRFRK